MSPETKQAILAGLQSDLCNASDSLYRAQVAFHGATPEQMDSPYGASQSTCRQLLEGYERWHTRAKAALEETKAFFEVPK